MLPVAVSSVTTMPDRAIASPMTNGLPTSGQTSTKSHCVDLCVLGHAPSRRPIQRAGGGVALRLRPVDRIDQRRRVDAGLDGFLVAAQACLGVGQSCLRLLPLTRLHARTVCRQQALDGLMELTRARTVASRLSGLNRRPIHLFTAAASTPSRSLTVVGCVSKTGEPAPAVAAPTGDVL